MKFGNVLRSGIAVMAFALAASAAQAAATPTYFFGNDPGALGNVNLGVESRAAEGRFTNQVLVTSTADFGTAASPTPQNPVYLYNSNNSMPIFGGTLVQAPAPPSGDYGDSYLGAGIISGEPTPQGRFNTTDNLRSGRWIETELSFSVNIGSRVGAFSFFGTDFADFNGSLVIELFDGTGTDPLEFDDGNGGTRTNVFIDPNTNQAVDPRGRDALGNRLAPQNGGMLFFGFASTTQFNRIQFTVSQSSNTACCNWDYLGFDDISIGNLRAPPPIPAPEPGSLALVGLALFAANWARKTRRRA